MAWNWLTPFVVVSLVFLPVYFALPGPAKKCLGDSIEKLERELRLVLWFTLLIIVFVVARISGWA
jgi:hypothetical protein